MQRNSLRMVVLLTLLCGISACHLNKTFQNSQDKTQTSSEPIPEAKGDRPQETGEGLPGYLLDPELLATTSVGNETEITAQPRAVRARKDGKTLAQKVWIIGYQEGTHSFRREQNQLILSGRLITTVTTQDNGAFVSRFPTVPGEIIFLRLSDNRLDQELAFTPGESASDRVFFDAGSGKFAGFDSSSSQKLSYTIDPTGTPLAQLSFLKTTRSCRGCTLAGSNLAGLDLNGCVLIGTNLQGADLTAADLRNCQMQSTNLTNANLTRADLSAADLTGANLTNAILTETILTNVKGYPVP